MTCCMRVSFESGLEITSLCAGSAANRSRQQPRPAMVDVVVSLMQCPCGTASPGAVPDPGCCCFGGSAYVCTGRSLLLRLTAGAVFSDAVFLSVQSTIWLDT